MKIDCFNDSLAIGEYFSLDLSEWEEISCSMIDEEWLTSVESMKIKE